MMVVCVADTRQRYGTLSLRRPRRHTNCGHFDFFFEYRLFGWSTDPAQWPKPRTRPMFREWFEVRIHTMVEDVLNAPYELEDL